MNKPARIRWDARTPAEVNARLHLPPLVAHYFAQGRQLLAANPQPAELHALRLATKRLRYTLEFFAPVLGAPVDPRVEQLTRVQDHLGNVQDAVIACGVLEDFLARGEWSDGAERSRRRPHAVTGAPGVAAYLAARRWEIQTLVQAFPQIWAPVRSTEFKKQLLSLIADW